MNKITPIFMTTLAEGEVFVHGSGPNGCYEGGEYGILANKKFGAEWKRSEGPSGQSYAIPVLQRDLYAMKPHVDAFIAYVKEHQELFFWVSPITQCFIVEDESMVAPMFRECIDMPNVALPEAYIDQLGGVGVPVEQDWEYEMIDGHPCVDLGLDVKWGVVNLGADKPSDAGDYYAWGEVRPGRNFTQDECMAESMTREELAHNGFLDEFEVLSPEHDAATQAWGPSWIMPTEEDLRQLMVFCLRIPWIFDGVEGRVFASMETGQWMFLPLSGYMDEEGLFEYGEQARYRASSAPYCSDGEIETFEFGYDGAGLLSFPKYAGLPIRPVVNPD